MNRFLSLVAGLSFSIVPLASAASPKWLTANDREIKAVVASMTLAEKVGQMTQPDIGSVKDLGDIEKLCLGSILSGGSSDPKTGNTMADWAALQKECQEHAAQTRLGIPLLYGVDAVHGHNNVLGAVVFPHDIGLGCTRNPALIEKAARATALEVRATGIGWTFAPCVTVPQDIRWGRTYEGYSENPKVVAELGAAAVRGFQGEGLPSPTLSVVACAKHFIGDGGTSFGTSKAGGLLDQGDTKVDEKTLRAVHLPGYPAAIDAGAATIMPSYSSWNGVKCSANKYLLTDLLKKELGFEGFLISDYNALDQIDPDFKKSIGISINAGMDMVMITERYPEFIKKLAELVNEGTVPVARIDDAVTRILRVKRAFGWWKGSKDLAPKPDVQAKFGSPEHRAMARQAVRESLVLLKNEGKILPLGKDLKRLHVAGRGADDIGLQCGGWTIDWQGKQGPVTTGGTTILQALRKAVGKGTEVTFAADGTGGAGASVGIVVVGEEPYAEMKGDRTDLGLSKQDVAVFQAMKSAGLKVVVVVLSGRPLILGPVAEQADAVVAAWLPGTEGDGVADVLCGTAAPKGKLSFSWPRSMEHVGRPADPARPPMYPLGHGLTW